MVEPVTTLTAATIVTLVATKAFEKTGEKVTEAVWNLVGRFVEAVRKKDVATATAIETASQNRQLSEQQTKVLTAKVAALATDDPDIQHAAQAIEAAIQAQPGALINMTQLAEKIGVVNQGTINNQSNTFSM